MYRQIKSIIEQHIVELVALNTNTSGVGFQQRVVRLDDIIIGLDVLWLSNLVQIMQECDWADDVADKGVLIILHQQLHEVKDDADRVWIGHGFLDIDAVDADMVIPLILGISQFTFPLQ